MKESNGEYLITLGLWEQDIYPHLWLNIGKNGRFDKVSIPKGFTAQVHCCTFFLSDVNIFHDALELYLVVLGALVDSGSEIVANLDLRHPFGEGIQEFVIDLFVDVKSCACVADLTPVNAYCP